MLSDWERRTLVEIERHLREDDRLDRALGSSLRRGTGSIRRFCFLLLAAAPVLAVALLAVGVVAGSLDAMLLGVVAAGLLYFNPPPRRPGG